MLGSGHVPVSKRIRTQEVVPLLELATKLLLDGRPAEAIAPLRNVALLQPSNAMIQHDLGLACLEVGRVPDAIAALQQAVANNPHLRRCIFPPGNRF
jgi:Flp pilus assembly protein TadD